ncbi:MAG: thiamine pyrophosphate-dependent enzyme [Saprospiraceae bacterium]|nr:thiamine pyrophosphate-dependent enzyme [Saprospiraceae bacterium]
MGKTKSKIKKKILLHAYRLMVTSKAMTDLYEANFKWVSRYVHATSRGHEAIQLAVGMQLQPQDYVSPYYRDESMLLGLGMRPYDLMLQLMAKRGDPFSQGRAYYCHPSLSDTDKPKIPHQSSATGMQAIPTTGIAMGIQYREQQGIDLHDGSDKPLVVCSMGDASVTEGEVSEALQMAALKQYPILYLVQDNGWDISANQQETRAMSAVEYAKGFPGIEALSIDGSDFEECYEAVSKIYQTIRTERRPFLLHAEVPLLNHHTSGVRKEWYRDDLEEHQLRDPIPIFHAQLLEMGMDQQKLSYEEKEAINQVSEHFEKASEAADPTAADLETYEFVPTPVKSEEGVRTPVGGDEKVMVDCGLLAIEELMRKHPECLFYGQDVGRRLGGVFREAATLAEKYGDERVFNTAIQEAFIVGSTVGLSAVGLKPIVEVQFADYIWPGLNQLFTEVSRSCYLTAGKYPVSMILRVPIGAYGGGGPYHSSSIESVLTNIRGIKIVYPSTGADLKGLMKAAYYDPNPVVILEHKGLYWSKMTGTEEAKSVLPDEDYILPLGKGRITVEVDLSLLDIMPTCTIITYGMGVYWAKEAAKQFPGQVEVIDLRSLVPLDEDLIRDSVKRHGRCLILSEEPASNSFAQALAGYIQADLFNFLDAPIKTVGSVPVPAVPLNAVLEEAMLPSAVKVQKEISSLLEF